MLRHNGSSNGSSLGLQCSQAAVGCTACKVSHFKFSMQLRAVITCTLFGRSQSVIARAKTMNDTSLLIPRELGRDFCVARTAATLSLALQSQSLTTALMVGMPNPPKYCRESYPGTMVWIDDAYTCPVVLCVRACATLRPKVPLSTPKVSVACTQKNAVTGPGLESATQAHEPDPEFGRNFS